MFLRLPPTKKIIKARAVAFVVTVAVAFPAIADCNQYSVMERKGWGCAFHKGMARGDADAAKMLRGWSERYPERASEYRGRAEDAERKAQHHWEIYEQRYGGTRD